jgi:hypothetical protein
LSAGDTGYIRGTGTPYNDFFDGNTDSFPSGTSFSNAVTISAYPNETVIIQNNQSGNKSAIFTYINAPQYMIWQDLIIDGRYHEAHESGITLNYGSYIRFTNIEIYWSVLPTPQTIARQQGFFTASGCDHLEFLDCEVHEVPSHAYYCGGNNILIQRGSVHHNGYYPGVLEDGGDPSEQHGLGAHFYGGTDNDCTVTELRAYLNRSAGILFGTGARGLAYNNFVWNNGAANWGLKAAFQIDCADVQGSNGSSNVKLYHNSIAHTDAGCRDNAGIKIENSSNISIVNNIVWGHDDLVDGFCFVDNNAGSSILLEDYNMSSDGTFPNASGHDVVNNPGWPDPANGDFTITISSPAYAACPRLAAVMTDAEGVSRPDPASMGALEPPEGPPPVAGNGTYSEISLGSLPDDPSHFIGPTCRNNSLLDSERSYYTVQLSRSGSTYILSLAKILNGVYVHIDDTSAETFTSGDGLRLEVTGSTTVMLSVKKNGVEVLAGTDTSLTADAGFGVAGGGALDAPALAWTGGNINAGVLASVASDLFSSGSTAALTVADGWTQQAPLDGLMYYTGTGAIVGGPYASVDAVVRWSGIPASSAVILGVGGGG